MLPLSPKHSVKETEQKETNVPTFLFHTTLTVVDFMKYSGGEVTYVYPLNTHAELGAAKAFAFEALQRLGYDRSDFDAYETASDWKIAGDHDNDGENIDALPDGTLVRARRPGMHDFLIGIYTGRNTEQLPTKHDNSAELQLPQSGGQLHYVLQTRIDYNTDRSGAVRSTDIEGVYIHRKDALDAAKSCLISDESKRTSFAEYDERDSETFNGQWPFGDDVIVHAVSQTGENYQVSVLTPLRAHEKHGKTAAQRN